MVNSEIVSGKCCSERGKDIREHEAWSIVSAELIKLASLYAIQIGSTADEIAALARDCYNQALQLSREQAGGLN
jgi:hypothetical protein